MDRWTLRESVGAPVRNSIEDSGLPWIPWNWINSRYSSAARDEFQTILKAYQRLGKVLDVNEIICQIPARRRDDACHRCGRCCAELLPEPVTQEIILRWMDAGNPAHLFHVPVKDGPMADNFHTGWYFEGVRLKMCPLLLRNPATGEKFCVIYHFGPGHRPPACEGFKANWPHCEVSQRPLVP